MTPALGADRSRRSPANQATSGAPGLRQVSRTFRARAFKSGRQTGRDAHDVIKFDRAQNRRRVIHARRAASRRSRGDKTPAGRLARTRASIVVRSRSRALSWARSANAKSAFHTRVSVQATERVMPGRLRMLSSSAKPPASSADRIAGSRSSERAGRAKPPASRAASCGKVMICTPASERRAASMRRMRKANGPSMTIVRRFIVPPGRTPVVPRLVAPGL